MRLRLTFLYFAHLFLIALSLFGLVPQFQKSLPGLSIFYPKLLHQVSQLKQLRFLLRGGNLYSCQLGAERRQFESPITDGWRRLHLWLR
jgi:hypothetical protein